MRDSGCNLDSDPDREHDPDRDDHDIDNNINAYIPGSSHSR